MKTHRIATAAAVLGALVLCNSTAQAAGFMINEHSARIMGMAGAYTGVADTPGTIYWNPAGLANLEGLSFEAGATLIRPGGGWRGTAPGTTTELEVGLVESTHLVPNLFASYRIHDMVAAGIGMYAPYGLTVEWPTQVDVDGSTRGWWGRGLIQKISLETVFISPTVAVQVHPRVLVGASFNIIPAAVELQRALTFSSSLDDDIDVHLSGGDVGFGAAAGVLVKVLPDLLNVGVNYRSTASFTFTGDAAFTKDGSAENIPIGLRSTLTDGPVEAFLDLPHVVNFGIAAFPIEGLTVSFNFDLITWSNYENLEIRFPENEALSSVEPKEWNNTVAIRLGGEYRVLPQLPVRLGFIFDQAPAPGATLGPELPDGDRYEFTIGGGYEYRGFSLDLAYMYLTTGDSPTTAAAPLVGVYTADAHLFGASLAYALDI